MASTVKYIFCITTGRSGTRSLTDIFLACDHVKTFHEPHPLLSGPILREYLNDNITDGGYIKQANEKLASIQEESKNGDVYIETSHLFSKSFGWYIIPKLKPENIGVVVLKRKKEEVVESYLRMKCTPLTWGAAWMYLPTDKKISAKPNALQFQLNRVKAIVDFKRKAILGGKEATDYLGKFLLEWSYDETYIQGEALLQKYPQITRFDISLPELSNEKKVISMFETFGLNYNREKLQPLLSQKLNVKGPVDSKH